MNVRILSIIGGIMLNNTKSYPVNEDFLKKVSDYMRIHIIKTPLILISSGEDDQFQNNP